MSRLGSGGMGEVYLGHDTLLDRPVAVKLLRDVSDCDDPSAAFLIEARAAARIQHPNVATIHRVGQAAGQHFIVSELVRGESLDSLGKPMAWPKALELAIGLARGLAAAHRRGVLHGDIKPANAILAEDGVVKLVDFGLAKLVDAESAAPDPESPYLLGTPYYMAPEIWSGQPLTRRSDVYAMGSLLYELLSGRPPFFGRQPDDIPALAVRGNIPSIAKLVSDIDPRFAEIVDRCLRRTPAERFASGEELREALEEVDEASRATAVPEGNPYRGLLAFEAEHRALFFGRDAEIGTILERLRTDASVLVAGDSGTGKSSLCRAGVLPRVLDGALDPRRVYRSVQLVPGRRPLAALASAIAQGLAPELQMTEQEVAAILRSEPEALRVELSRYASESRERKGREGPQRGVIVFIDQLEELITISDPEEAAIVAEVLGRLALRAPGVRLLMSIRGDFLARATSLPGLGDELTHALYLLRPLSPEKMRQAIIGPAKVKGVSFESDELVEVLIRSTGRTEGGLPLLQFALGELWDAKAASEPVITARSLEEIGGVEGALARHADHVLNRMPPSQQAAARRMLCALVTLQRTRARRMEQELTGNDPHARAALEALVSGRLLVAREAEGGTAVEIAHEALLTGWFTLRRMLDEQAEARVVRDRLETAAADWRRIGKNREALWGSAQLAETARLDVEFLSDVEKEFLAASRRSLQQRRRLRAALLLLVPIGVASVYGAAALKARRDVEARLAQYRHEAASLLAESERFKRELDDIEGRAFAAFDSQRRDEGEGLWTDARSHYASLDAQYRDAGQKIEAALALDTGHADVREDLARVLHLRIVLAERRHQSTLREELIQRLEVYDTAGRLRKALDAPARIHIESTPPGAEASIARYDLDTAGRAGLGPPRELGSAPLDAAGLTPGSYLLTLRAQGCVPVHYPVLLKRDESLPLRVPMLRQDQVPTGFVYIPAGRFLFGSADDDVVRRSFLVTVPQHEVQTGAYLIARRETTFGEWIDYLKALSPGDRQKRLPRVVEGDITGAIGLSEQPDGTFKLVLKPSTQTLSASWGEPVVYPARAAGRAQNWLRLPVVGVSLDDINDYLGWLDRTARVPGARLCSDHEWERAARGADDRIYPHGSSLSPEEANYYDTYGKDPINVGPDEVGSHPRSTSPFGVDDMTGNAFEWVSSSLAPNEWAIRGGAFAFDSVSARSNNRTIVDKNYQDSRLGLRICAPIADR